MPSQGDGRRRGSAGPNQTTGLAHRLGQAEEDLATLARVVRDMGRTVLTYAQDGELAQVEQRNTPPTDGRGARA